MTVSEFKIFYWLLRDSIKDLKALENPVVKTVFNQLDKQVKDLKENS